MTPFGPSRSGWRAATYWAASTLGCAWRQFIPVLTALRGRATSGAAHLHVDRFGGMRWLGGALWQLAPGATLQNRFRVASVSKVGVACSIHSRWSALVCTTIQSLDMSNPGGNPMFQNLAGTADGDILCVLKASLR
jgi:hypothetical protein